MEFETKANAKNEQETPMKMKDKESVDNSIAMELGDMASDDGTGNEQILKSPDGETPKGEQPLGDRKVSFQVPGENSPGNEEKTALKEFTGMKTNGKRKAQDSDDDDDDDDNDDEEEEEEQQNIKPSAENKTKTPVKAEKTLPKVDVMKSVNLTLDQKREKDIRSLYMGNLPLDVKKEELQALSSDILEVYLANSKRIRKWKKKMFAFLIFANESKAEENFKIIKEKKFRNSDITLDFAGEKSNFQKHSKPTANSSQCAMNLEPIKLLIRDLPINTTIDRVAQLFPTAFNIYINDSTKIGYALFKTFELAAEAYETNQDARIFSQRIIIEFTENKKHKKNKRKSKSSRRPAAKKAKVEDNEDIDDDDEDD